jgi:hypothetical protein
MISEMYSYSDTLSQHRLEPQNHEQTNKKQSLAVHSVQILTIKSPALRPCYEKNVCYEQRIE